MYLSGKVSEKSGPVPLPLHSLLASGYHETKASGKALPGADDPAPREGGSDRGHQSGVYRRQSLSQPVPGKMHGDPKLHQYRQAGRDGKHPGESGLDPEGI